MGNSSETSFKYEALKYGYLTWNINSKQLLLCLHHMCILDCQKFKLNLILIICAVPSAHPHRLCRINEFYCGEQILLMHLGDINAYD